MGNGPPLLHGVLAKFLQQLEDPKWLFHHPWHHWELVEWLGSLLPFVVIYPQDFSLWQSDQMSLCGSWLSAALYQSKQVQRAAQTQRG